MVKKLNCWEFKNCGRQPGGDKITELGVCPVAYATELHGVHDGWNAGRSCWVIAGSYCKGRVQGTFAQKFKDCQECDFYKQVKNDEFPNFKLTAVLLGKIKK